MLSQPPALALRNINQVGQIWNVRRSCNPNKIEDITTTKPVALKQRGRGDVLATCAGIDGVLCDCGVRGGTGGSIRLLLTKIPRSFSYSRPSVLFRLSRNPGCTSALYPPPWNVSVKAKYKQYKMSESSLGRDALDLCAPVQAATHVPRAIGLHVMCSLPRPQAALNISEDWRRINIVLRIFYHSIAARIVCECGTRSEPALYCDMGSIALRPSLVQSARQYESFKPKHKATTPNSQGDPSTVFQLQHLVDFDLPQVVVLLKVYLNIIQKNYSPLQFSKVPLGFSRIPSSDPDLMTMGPNGKYLV
ncbi:unnamed protein product [Spodoptera exigua]|nr:unnamed protein product [Spodoptera exigua]